MSHGTSYRYDQGCRCDECRKAKMLARRHERDKARAQGRPSYHRELAASRALKERYRGTCHLCGAATTGCFGPDKAPTVCGNCAPAHYGPQFAAARRGHGPQVSKALEFLAEPRRYSELRDHLGVTGGNARVILHRLRGYGLIRRVSHGVYVREESPS